jgi:hypothetical protein
MTTPADSPALKFRTFLYPAAWNGQVPMRVRMIRTVRSYGPLTNHQWWVGGRSRAAIVAIEGYEFDCWTGSSGEIAILFLTGEVLVLKPDEFTVIEWHEGEKV